MLPEFLEQCRIEWDVCGIPVLMFADSEEGAADSGASGAAEGAADSGEAGTSAGQAADLRPFFAFMNRSYGFKRLDCLDLMKLMTDSDFLFDVCRACNEGEITPHVFPANRTACARLAEKEPGYAAAFDILENQEKKNLLMEAYNRNNHIISNKIIG